MVTTEQIKSLRERTGVSVMQCKKALEEAGGDEEKAVIILRKVSRDAVAKKADRELGSGAVASYVHANGKVGAMVLLLSETDFVANNEEFRTLARDIAMHVTAANPAYLSRVDVSDADVDKAKSVFQKDVEGKPADIQEKIMSGKLDAYFAEKVLLEQPFIKDAEHTIGNLIEGAVQKFGERIEVGQFTRFSV